MKIKKDQLIKQLKELTYTVADRAVYREQGSFGPRTFWFAKGLETAAMAMVFALYPKYRGITGTIAAAVLLRNLKNLGAIQYLVSQYQFKMYPVPTDAQAAAQQKSYQDLFNGLFNNLNKDKNNLS